MIRDKAREERVMEAKKTLNYLNVSKALKNDSIVLYDNHNILKVSSMERAYHSMYQPCHVLLWFVIVYGGKFVQLHLLDETSMWSQFIDNSLP